MSDSNSNMRQSNFFSIARSKGVMPRAIKVALIVGTILALINHGDQLISLELSALTVFKVILTYFVPFSVSAWSSVQVIQANNSQVG